MNVKRRRQKKEEPIKMNWKGWLIIAFIVLALIALFLSGGQNQSWWPGKPIHLR